MKYIVFSDVLGNIEAMESLRDFSKRFPKYRFICLGNLVEKGESYNENWCVAVSQKLKARCIKGFNEERVVEEAKGLEDETSEEPRIKITSVHIDILKGLDKSMLLEDRILCYHSSIRNYRNALVSDNDLLAEARFISTNFPNVDFALFGNRHEPMLCTYDIKNDELVKYPPVRKIQLENGKLHLINPGGIGFQDSTPTFVVLDTDKNIVGFYTINLMEEMLK